MNIALKLNNTMYRNLDNFAEQLYTQVLGLEFCLNNEPGLKLF